MRNPLLSTSFFSSPRNLLLLLSFIALGGYFVLFAPGPQGNTATAAPAPAAATAPSRTAPSPYRIEQRSYPKGLSSLVGITGRKSGKGVVVRVLKDGKPAPGETVEFRLMSGPAKAKGAKISAQRAVTDAKGLARVDLTLGDAEGDYVVAAYLHGSVVKQAPVVTKVRAMTPGWIAFLIIGLIGGLGLFLYGMNLAGEHLQKAAGEQMRSIIGSLARNRVSGTLLGTVASAVLQSSSAATVMLVGFVSATMMTLTQAISVMIGTKIGVTITLQLIAFNISKYALAIVGAGAILIMAAGKREKLKHAGCILLGFGLIFFGLSIMSGAMKPMRGMPEFTGLLLKVGSSAVLAVLLGTMFTAIIQSAAATVAICMALAAQGLMPLSAAIPISIGSSIGTCATALLASFGATREGKRVAVVHLLFSVMAAVLYLPFAGPFVGLTNSVTAWMGSDSVVRAIANGFMLYSIFAAVVFLPFVSQLEWLVVKLIPKQDKPPPFGPKYLSEASLQVPVLALDQAHKEVERMARIFAEALRSSGEVIEDGEPERIAELIEEDDKLDILEKAIRPYLAKVAQKGLAEEAAARERALIYITEHLEDAGDMLAKQMLRPMENMRKAGNKFSGEGAKELQRYHEKMVEKAERIEELIRTSDRALAEQVLQISFKENQLERKLRDSHLERLHAGGSETVESSRDHLAVLSGLHAVGAKLSSVADEILREL